VPRSSIDYKTFGKTIAIGNIQKGDVLIFLSPTRNEIGHVGIVTKPSGMETEFIHATSGKEMMVVLSSLKQENYNRRFVKAISVL
jgi:cell wall-associated NlpC family hydrolase